MTAVARAAGALSTRALAEWDARLPWFRDMPAEQRSWVGLVAQAGITGFVSWLKEGGPPEVPVDAFEAAPRQLTRAVTFQQTVQLIRMTVAVAEADAPALAAKGDEAAIREAVLRYSREVAFAAAEVYASAAEVRGSWDARLESLVVDALLRGETDEFLRSRTAALGWGSPAGVTVAVGDVPADLQRDDVLDALQAAARAAPIHLDLLAAVHGDRLVVVIGSDVEPLTAVAPLLGVFADGPVVVGPVVRDLAEAGASADIALAGRQCVAAWPDAPRPVPADALLAERALAGDTLARLALVSHIFEPLAEAGGDLLQTVTVLAQCGGSIEGSARALFVHANTVRYRMRRVADVTGLNPTDPHDALTLQVALMLGRLEDAGTLL